MNRRTRKSRATLALLIAGGLCACASDVWFKPGAGPAALAEDKAACRRELADAGSADDARAFERCMADRSWWHRTPGAASGTPARASLSPLAGPAEPLPGSDPSVSGSETGSSPLPGVAAPADTASSTSGPSAPRVDPDTRQFWFKLGAGTAQLENDQQSCRTELGVPAAAESPSRWGEDAGFDTCMRGRGWRGGSLEAR